MTFNFINVELKWFEVILAHLPSCTNQIHETQDRQLRHDPVQFWWSPSTEVVEASDGYLEYGDAFTL